MKERKSEEGEGIYEKREEREKGSKEATKLIKERKSEGGKKP